MQRIESFISMTKTIDQYYVRGQFPLKVKITLKNMHLRKHNAVKVNIFVCINFRGILKMGVSRILYFKF